MIVVSVDILEEGLHLYEYSQKIMTSANMNLRKWQKNSENLREKIMKTYQISRF